MLLHCTETEGGGRRHDRSHRPHLPPGSGSGLAPDVPSAGGDERPSTRLSLLWQAPRSDAAPQRPSLRGRGTSLREQRAVSGHRKTCPPTLPQSHGDPGGHRRRTASGGRASVVSTPVRRAWWPGVTRCVRGGARRLGHTLGSSKRSYGDGNTAGSRPSRSPGGATRAGPQDRAAPGSQRQWSA